MTATREVLTLFDHLLTLPPTPVGVLNRAVAVAEVEGTETALAIVESLNLPASDLSHAVRADLISRLGRPAEAAAAYQVALAPPTSGAERRFPERRCAGRQVGEA